VARYSARRHTSVKVACLLSSLTLASILSSRSARASDPPAEPPIVAPPRRVLPYNDGDPVPPGYHVERRHPKWMIGTGAGALAGGYLISLTIAALTGASCLPSDSICRDRDTGPSPNRALYIPLVGPFVVIAQGNAMKNLSSLIFLGTSQVGGATLLALGFATYQSKLVPDWQAAKIKLLPLPLAGGGELMVTGSF